LFLLLFLLSKSHATDLNTTSTVNEYRAGGVASAAMDGAAPEFTPGWRVKGRTALARCGIHQSCSMLLLLLLLSKSHATHLKTTSLLNAFLLEKKSINNPA